MVVTILGSSNDGNVMFADTKSTQQRQRRKLIRRFVKYCIVVSMNEIEEDVFQWFLFINVTNISTPKALHLRNHSKILLYYCNSHFIHF